MKFYTDSYFEIGKRHLTLGKPCQDYADVMVLNEMAFSVVSDGCSSGGRTDIGARILTLASMSGFRKVSYLDFIKNDISLVREIINVKQKKFLNINRNNLGLQISDCLATCLYVYLSKIGGIVNVQGDGVVAFKYRSGKIVALNFEWADNMPYYPIYQKGNLRKFIKVHKGLDARRCICEEIVSNNDDLISADKVEYSVRAGIEGFEIKIYQEMLADLEYVAIFSDGVAQIDGMNWDEAVRKFLAFKNNQGEFVKRRMIRGLKNACKIGKGAIDDISMAVIRIDNEEKNK